ncbi:MAG TPA: DNA helicase RecQ [Spirochaetota bacterium]|nr:DNA helicase RecQ [Spirochaetota bacterium]
MTDTARSILKHTFGYDTFRPLQEEIIRSVLSKRDTLAIMPTGGGKSICYQIPALLFEGLTVVVSPLISLMKDQVDQLRGYGVPALALNSMIDPDEYRENVMRITDGAAKILYAAPETLLKRDIASLLASVRVDCIAIDEAHCISEWGHDFRPEYRQMAAFRAGFPDAVCVALTATATEAVRRDIVESLRLRDAGVYVASFNRENLFFQVLPKDDAYAQLAAFLSAFPGQSGIVYCFSRNGVDALAARLADAGHSVLPYHAGLEDEVRKQNQERFIRDEVQIIVATIAFGMGIHKSNIRFVVHYDLPKSIESYYQETGRAGRDGLPAHCLLLYSYGDIHKIRFFINQKEDDRERANAERHLRALVDYAEATGCRRAPLIAYFGEAYEHDDCGMCDNCTQPPAPGEDLTVPAQKLLSCVKRVNERFGVNHIIDVLRGSESQKILSYDHHRLSTYGIGADYSKKQWLHLARQFIRQGLMVQDMENFGVLTITRLGYDVMRGDVTVRGTIINDRCAVFAGGKSAQANYDRELFERLRKLRMALASAGGVPPYVVFSDRTLSEMASRYPRDRAALLDIHGVGEHKCERYGDEFLVMIRDYCAERNID